MFKDVSGDGPRYHVEVSYHENPRNKKKYVVLKEHDVPFQVVQDMIGDVLEKVGRGSAELRHILVYMPDDPEYGL